MAVNGPIARTVSDAALFLDATATDTTGVSFSQAASKMRAPLRIAVAWNSLAKCPMAARLGPEQRNAVTQTVALLEELGHTVTERKLSFSRHGSSNVLVRYLSGIAHSADLCEDVSELSKRTKILAHQGRRISERRLTRALRNESFIAAAFAASGRIIPHYGPWNLIGQPAATVPTGFDKTGLPLSVHLAGRPNDELTLLSVAAQIETARPWSQHRPPLDS